MTLPLPLASFRSDPVYAYLWALKMESKAAAEFRTNPHKIADEHARVVSQIESEAFANVARSRVCVLVVDNTK